LIEINTEITPWHRVNLLGFFKLIETLVCLHQTPKKCSR